ncbi:Porin subfamily protein [Pseudovibrio denitrificans]|uniref:Porin n=1 Tax=Pseudovibrio denitrificans TaxID=258256 RepID=A0A1I7C4A9_9HYPH|nr:MULTISPECIES: porin [Pseudovibrio]EEA92441.1 outer membrane protein [Pseudovibrio sp. JE062]SFT94246.1 Porin subfamily protein [Pseudovibrio denitrificans]
MRHFTTSAAAALMMSATPVLAADLPVAPEPVEYVQICDAYGTGYFYIPGTDTCLRIRGRVRAEYRFNNFGAGPSDWSERTRNSTSTRARGYLRMDARTQTEYGLLRAYIDLFGTVDTPGFIQDDSSVPNVNNPVGSFGVEQDNTVMTLDYAFVQFGGMTIGRAQSFYDFWTGYAYGAITTVAYSDQNLWLAGYTFDLGNGLSTSWSVEDRTARQQNLFTGEYLNSTGFNQGYGGMRFPDLVANIRLDQGWGSAQIMGALTEVRYLESYPSGLLGWAVGGGVEFNLPFFTNYLSGFQGVVQATFSQGALGYVNSDWQNVIWDATSLTDGEDGIATGWSIAWGFQADFSPEWNAAIQASFANARSKFLWNQNQWDVVGKIGWTPVSGFEIGTEVAYRNVGLGDLYPDTTVNGGNPTRPLGQQDIISILLRVQRDF